MDPKQANLQQAYKGATSRPKILRLGLILGDKIVEEQLIRDRKPVTIGQSAKNTFAIPAPELPKTWALFELIGGRYVLNVAESMDGRISDGNDVSTLAQLRSSGKATKVGDHWQVGLSDAARGKILIGDVSILFQFVQAPPLQPRPQLPHSVRGSFADRIDPYLAVILSISLMAHTALYIHYKFFVDEPKPPPPDVIPDQFARVLVEAPRPPEPAKTEDKGNAAEEEKGKDEPKADEKPKGDKKPDPKPAEEQSAEAKVASTAPVRVLKQLSGKGGSGAPLLGPGDDKEAWGDLGKGLNKVGSGEVVAGVGTTSGQSTRGTGDGTVATGTGTGVSGPTGPGSTTSGPKKEEDVKVSGSQGRIEDIDAAGLDPDKVSATIRSRYYPRVVQCYQRALKANPSLGGKVNVTFTVGIAGNVVKVDADGFDGGVDSCIEAEARRWRFDRPEGPATFEISFVLRKA